MKRDTSKEQKDVVTTLRISPELLEALRVEAEDEDRSVNSLIIRILKQHRKEYEARSTQNS